MQPVQAADAQGSSGGAGGSVAGEGRDFKRIHDDFVAELAGMDGDIQRLRGEESAGRLPLPSLLLDCVRTRAAVFGQVDVAALAGRSDDMSFVRLQDYRLAFDTLKSTENAIAAWAHASSRDGGLAFPPPDPGLVDNIQLPIKDDQGNPGILIVTDVVGRMGTCAVESGDKAKTAANT
jgi:hypothetical protein